MKGEKWHAGDTRRGVGSGYAGLLQDKPLCELCIKIGRIEPATVVDHITTINSGGDPFPGLDQLMSLCASCHNQKSRCAQIGEDYTIKGCDLFGYPLDPRHPWYRA